MWHFHRRVKIWPGCRTIRSSLPFHRATRQSRSRLTALSSSRTNCVLSSTTMEITNYLPFRCIIFVSESTLIVGVRTERPRLAVGRTGVSFQGHEFSPLIYNYDGRRGTIEFVEKLDQQNASTGRQSIKCERRSLESAFLLISCFPSEESEFFTPYQASYAG